ncbi:uncharacterized protein PV06_11165 [Exophiala oligosperma]|uniref:CDAN1-interacting nuclease 1 n=1 Tax=Exophiala oligosperma TaxID=215243 RepID=A0A0D2D058_9EURO|nr:uncharacterized protein PV06_11165 [Exophiala oligosperma]KIW36653.1 hypothetical protein PV06_11165 [Exophiala oligosperma]
MHHCFDCDRAFSDVLALRQHLRDSSAHALGFRRDDCNRGFGSDDAFRQHLRDSPAHSSSFDCDDCHRSFGSEDALEQHRPNSKGHSRQQVKSLRVSPKADKTSTTDKRTRYDGISPSLIKPVYKLAVRLRRGLPTVEDIVLATGTRLERPIVVALIAAAERLNSLSESREDAQRRAERQKERSRLAQLAEDAFIGIFSRQGLDFTTESQQRQQAKLLEQRAFLTPDMKFTSPVMICGLLCNWLEFKDYFGFPDNPFVSSSERKQLKKYVVAFGSGAVVYLLGFQNNYPNIKDVGVFRAREVLQNLLGSSGI